MSQYQSQLILCTCNSQKGSFLMHHCDDPITIACYLTFSDKKSECNKPSTNPIFLKCYIYYHNYYSECNNLLRTSITKIHNFPPHKHHHTIKKRKCKWRRGMDGSTDCHTISCKLLHICHHLVCKTKKSIHMVNPHHPHSYILPMDKPVM